MTARGPDPELAAEQAVIDRAYARLEAMRTAARALADDGAPPDQRLGGTHQARYERDVRVHLSARRLAELAEAEGGLCFGRIDRLDGERLYIGRVAISDEDNEALVVDWRAPAAEPFYRATPANPMGLRRRRHFVLAGRRLVAIEDDLLELGGDEGAGDDLVLKGEAALLASLGRARTGRMADIVATIQAEQDEIIRAPLPGVLVVQGGPGTGKTAVALHRAAYLLYTHRFPLERAGVLVMGPSRVFLRYIDRVLPALGEQSVAFATTATLVPGLRPRDVDDPRAATLKADARMVTMVARAVAQRQRPLRRPAVAHVGRHRLTLDPPASRRLVERARRARGTHNQRRRLVERAVLRHLEGQWARWRREEGMTDEADLALTPDERRRLRRHPAVIGALERMWPVLTPEALLHDLFGWPALLAEVGEGLLDPGEQALLHRPWRGAVADLAWSPADVPLLDEAATLLGPVPARARPARAGPGSHASASAGAAVAERALEDVPELDEVLRADLLRHLARWAEPDAGDDAGEDGMRTFGHVVVDEAQDLSVLQLRMLARRCPGGSMTVVGDLGQASRAWSASAWSEVLEHLPRRRPPRVVELSVNYRTPVEVMDLAARVLRASSAQATPPRSVRAAGIPPTMTRAAGAGDLAAAAARAAAAEREAVGTGAVGLLVPAGADALVRDVRTRLGLAAEADEVVALDEAVSVLTVEGAKGLEFDAVVVVEPAAVAEPAGTGGDRGLRALYVALTRTTRRLHLVHHRPLPPALAGTEPA